jgi:hypothetical protein
LGSPRICSGEPFVRGYSATLNRVSTVPLLWVIPLSLYLLTFVLAFSTRFKWPRRTARRLPSIIVAAMMIFLVGVAVRPGFWGATGLLRLFCFVMIALAFHTELAHRRPGSQHLTKYYLWVSGGGIIGGLLNSVIAPAIFSDFWEYPLTLLLAAALLPKISAVSRRPMNLKVVGVAIAIICVLGIGMQMTGSPISPGIRIGALAAGAILCIRVPVRWTASILLLIALSVGRVSTLQPLYQGRSFFGRYQVSTAADGKWHILSHGTTLHGLQRVTDSPLRLMPRAYYVPVKTAFDVALSNKPSASIAAVGLGAGIVGCYIRPEQSITFFEIDPLVEHIAKRYFTLLSECAGHKKVILGDARLTLAAAKPHSVDVIVLDAFSSDAIPIHLLTKDAFRLYREKLTVDGLILVHISNSYMDLAPVVAGSGAQAGYSTLVLDDMAVTRFETEQGRKPSRWALVGPYNSVSDFETHGWRPFSAEAVNWTDDHSSILDVMMWGKLFGTDLLTHGWTRVAVAH